MKLNKSSSMATSAAKCLAGIMEAADHSGLIGRCLLMQNLSSLLQANPEWTKRKPSPFAVG